MMTPEKVEELRLAYEYADRRGLPSKGSRHKEYLEAKRLLDMNQRTTIVAEGTFS